MKEEYKEFIGIYDESVPVELCNEFVENWQEAKKNATIIDMTKENVTQRIEKTPHPLARKDEIAYISPLFSTMYPVPPVQAYFDVLRECFNRYLIKYGIDFQGKIYNNVFKLHRVRQAEGFHAWHYERSTPHTLDRIMAYMTYLEVPPRGGETEFLHQSLRIEPIVGRTLIWPATYTHIHRGNPPLGGEKMYIDGWFNCAKIAEDSPNK